MFHSHRDLFAAIAAVLFVVSVFGAQELSKMAERGDLPIVALVRSEKALQRMAKAAPAPAELPGRDATPYARAQSEGIDGIATAALAP